jgi:NitT/TauT family transport system substrate-binding protein
MRKKTAGLILAGLFAAALFIGGCGGNKQSSANADREARVVHVGYYGGTCEAPIYVAHEKGLFQKNGLTAELVKITAATTKEGIATGKLDAIMMSPGGFKAMEQGLNIKLTGGIHTGCIQAVVPVDSPVRSIADLKDKTIGVDAIAFQQAGWEMVEGPSVLFSPG